MFYFLPFAMLLLASPTLAEDSSAPVTSSTQQQPVVAPAPSPITAPQAQQGPAAQQTYMQPLLKDPYVAGVFSLLLPGLGHIYTEQLTRSVLLFSATLVPLIAARVIFAVQQDDMEEVFLVKDTDGKTHRVVQIPMHEDGSHASIFGKMNALEKTAFVSGIAVGAGMYLYTAIDAVLKARQYNRDYLQARYSVAPVITPDGAAGAVLSMDF